MVAAGKINKVNVVILSILLFSLTSCYTYKIFEAKYSFDPSRYNEIIINDALKDFLSKNKKPKFVLRTPDYQSSVTSDEKAASELYYSTIEKTLLKNGYTLRDRALLNQLLQQNQSYEQIAKKIDTDLILEIQNIKIFDNNVYDYTVPSKNFNGNLQNDQYLVQGKVVPGASPYNKFGPITQKYTQIAIKIILIKSGEFGGYMKLNYARPDPSNIFYISLCEKNSTGMIMSDNTCTNIGWKNDDVKYKNLIENYYSGTEQGKEMAFEALTMTMLKQMELIK